MKPYVGQVQTRLGVCVLYKNIVAHTVVATAVVAEFVAVFFAKHEPRQSEDIRIEGGTRKALGIWRGKHNKIERAVETCEKSDKSTLHAWKLEEVVVLT